MGEIIAFPQRPRPNEDVDLEEILAVDLLTAVDCAIRDLREIALLTGSAMARTQAEECRTMLQRAFDAALREG